MIQIILLKDAVANKGVVFAKAVVIQNGFQIDLAVGHIKKPKDLVSPAGTVAMELPMSMSVTEQVVSFTNEGTGEIKQITMIKVGQ